MERKRKQEHEEFQEIMRVNSSACLLPLEEMKINEAEILAIKREMDI